MDLASSPRMPADDLDLPYELDAMRDASVEPSQEVMIEEPINLDRGLPKTSTLLTKTS